MNRHDAFKAAEALVRQLAQRQSALAISDYAIEQLTGLCHKNPSNWRRLYRRPSLENALAWADALDLEIIIRERGSPSSTVST